MIRRSIATTTCFVIVLSVALAVQAQEGPGGGPPMVVGPRALPPGGPMGPGPVPLLREYAQELRARAREAQELADRLRRQADELDLRAKQLMDRGRGPQDLEPRQRELAEIREAIGRAEREGRRDEAAELRRRAEELMGPVPPMPPGPPMDERQEIKRQIERLRNEAQRAKEEGRGEEGIRIWKEADRLEQKLREQDERQKREPIERVRGEVQEILRSAERAEREGRMEDARRQREKAEIVARQLEERRRQGFEQPGRREEGTLGKGGDGQAGPQYEEVLRAVEELRREIGRLWQTVKEMRGRPEEARPR